MAALTFGSVCRAKPGREVCGDCFGVFEQNGRALIAVVDGLGSGPAAELASTAAIACAERYAEESVETVFDNCHEHLRGTRGAAMALVVIDSLAHCVQAAAVGNVEVRSRRSFGLNPVPVSGIVGANYRTPRPARAAYTPGEWLVIHSDGVRPTFDLDSLLLRGHRGAQDLADRLAAECGREDDDLTVLVVQLP